MMTDPLKDLQHLKSLFPEMEDYRPDLNEEQPNEEKRALSDKEKVQMKLYVSRDKKQRGGKQVTLVEGFEGPEDIMQELHSKLKSLCSAGGSLKDDVLMIQGDHVKKVMAYLIKAGYKQVKQKGG